MTLNHVDHFLKTSNDIHLSSKHNQPPCTETHLSLPVVDNLPRADQDAPLTWWRFHKTGREVKTLSRSDIFLPAVFLLLLCFVRLCWRKLFKDTVNCEGYSVVLFSHFHKEQIHLDSLHKIAECQSRKYISPLPSPHLSLSLSLSE